MKYLLTSLAILASLLLGLLIAPLLTPRPVPVAGSLVINQKIYLPQELEERFRRTPYHFDNKDELISDLIYRELLLQEAKQQKIDTETSFLRSMRDFYEQSMIKTLLDRQYRAEDHQPNTVQISACQPFLSRRFEIKCYDYTNFAAAEAKTPARQETYRLPYLELPEDIRPALFDLSGGGLSAPRHSGSGWFRLQLVGITPLAKKDIPPAVEQEELCRGELKRQSIQRWVEGLYRKSNIEIPQNMKGE